MVFGFLRNLFKKRGYYYLEIYKEKGEVKVSEVKEDKYKDYLEITA